MNTQTVEHVQERLGAVNVSAPKAFVGLDGFIDEIIHVVDKRLSSDRYKPIETIAEYGERIARSAGVNSNIEFAVEGRKIGGNGPIYASGLAKYGVDVTYVGAVGVREHDPVFDELFRRADVIGIAEPAKTEALEFNDGKIICSKVGSLNALGWNDLIGVLGAERLTQLFRDSQVISFNNWTMIPHMNEIWEHLLNEVIPCVELRRGPKRLFLDLADPRKRTNSDVTRALDLIREFQSAGLLVQLGLNKQEAVRLIAVTDGTELDPHETSLEELAGYLANQLRVHTLIVHGSEGASSVEKGRFVKVSTSYCAKPKISTGAGDTFNSGYMLGQLLELDQESSLLLGNAASGFYMRNGRQADRAELSRFLDTWKEETEQEGER